ncbi:MAG: copper chaperone PCu(A)C [Pseudomonadota bacterium]
MLMKIAPPLLLAATALAGCSSENDAANAAPSDLACKGDAIVVADAWMRPARAGQPTAAAYFSICNGGEADAMTDVAFAGADAAELHKTEINDAGVASMRPAKTVDLPTGETVTLAPGGSHVMLIGIGDDIALGDRPVLDLQFENAASIKAVVEVRDDKAGGHKGH